MPNLPVTQLNAFCYILCNFSYFVSFTSFFFSFLMFDTKKGKNSIDKIKWVTILPYILYFCFCCFCTHQKSMRSVFATNNVKQTYNEKPSASCVCWIWRYCGTYGMTPPTTIAEAAAQPTTCETFRFNSSLIIQSMIFCYIFFFSLIFV